MEGLLMNTQTTEKLGEEWMMAITDKDFDYLMKICHPAVKSSLLLPRQIHQLENAIDLSKKVEDWFGEYATIERVSSRVAMVGEKLGISYRLRCVDDNGAPFLIEQQIYSHMSEGLIDRVWLVCSGFQSDKSPVSQPIGRKLEYSSTNVPSMVQPAFQSHAFLEFKADASNGSTCSLLTPYIKQKLAGISSGQVLEVHVDDLSAKEDIEAWSRLSGNRIIQMDSTNGRDLVFFISKK